MTNKNNKELREESFRSGELLEYSKFSNIARYSLFIGLFLMIIAAPGVPKVIWWVLLFWSLKGIRQSLQTLTLLMLIRLLNPVIYQFGDTSVALFYVVLVVACSRIFLGTFFLTRKRIERPLVLLLLIFGIYGALNAVFFSYYPAVSLTKIILFTYAACAIIVGFQINTKQRVNWTPWFLGMWAAVVCLSLPTLIFSEIGYARDGQGFQGILNHPQTFAVFLAPMVCWMIGQYLFVKERKSFMYLAITSLAVGLMLLTLARTAIIAVTISIAIIFIFKKRYRLLIIGILGKKEGFLLMLCIVAALLFFQPHNLMVEFILKGSDSQDIGDAFEHSRGFLITRAFTSFLSHPLVGIGFGVSFEDYFKPVYDIITGLPISAATEKSLLPVVLLEELGIIGFILFIMVLYKIIKFSLSSRGIGVPILILSCLMVNIGEMVLFSIAGLGLYLWLLIGWALSLATLDLK